MCVCAYNKYTEIEKRNRVFIHTGYRYIFVHIVYINTRSYVLFVCNNPLFIEK